MNNTHIFLVLSVPSPDFVLVLEHIQSICTSGPSCYCRKLRPHQLKVCDRELTLQTDSYCFLLADEENELASFTQVEKVISDKVTCSKSSKGIECSCSANLVWNGTHCNGIKFIMLFLHTFLYCTYCITQTSIKYACLQYPERFFWAHLTCSNWLTMHYHSLLDISGLQKTGEMYFTRFIEAS